MEPASCKNNPPLTDDTWIVRRATYRRIVAANYRLSTNVQSCKLPRTPRDSSQKPERATLGSGGAQQFPRRLPAGRERRLAGDLNRGPPDPSLPGRPRRGRSPPWPLATVAGDGGDRTKHDDGARDSTARHIARALPRAQARGLTFGEMVKLNSGEKRQPLQVPADATPGGEDFGLLLHAGTARNLLID